MHCLMYGEAAEQKDTGRRPSAVCDRPGNDLKGLSLNFRFEKASLCNTTDIKKMIHDIMRRRKQAKHHVILPSYIEVNMSVKAINIIRTIQHILLGTPMCAHLYSFNFVIFRKTGES